VRKVAGIGVALFALYLIWVTLGVFGPSRIGGSQDPLLNVFDRGMQAYETALNQDQYERLANSDFIGVLLREEYPHGSNAASLIDALNASGFISKSLNQSLSLPADIEISSETEFLSFSRKAHWLTWPFVWDTLVVRLGVNENNIVFLDGYVLRNSL